MRMAWRMRLFTVAFFGGVPMSAVLGGEKNGLTVMFGWFACFAILQFFVFRCPHCGRLAIFTPRGAATPFVGDRCRQCGQPY
jgi:hypothetical protein